MFGYGFVVVIIGSGCVSKLVRRGFFFVFLGVWEWWFGGYFCIIVVL